MDELMKQIKELESGGEKVSAIILRLEKQVHELTITINQHECTINDLTGQLSEKQLVIDKSIDTIKTLELKLQQLEDEKTAFSRVSQIIAMEKENARLRSELEQMSLRLKTNSTITPPSTSISNEEPAVNQDLYEKKIKGTVYKVSHVDNVIYAQDNDGNVGQRVGVLTKTQDGKTKVSWD
jgi:uncharacterized coiled-coil protein SlyX